MRHIWAGVGIALAILAGQDAAKAEEPNARAGSMPSRAAVIAAIQTMQRAPLGPEADAARSAVVRYAKASTDVSVAIRPEFFQFANSTHDSMLMAHYLAGAVEFDLAHPQQAHDEVADVPSALGEAVRAYRALQEAKIVYYNAFFEIVDARERAGELERLVGELASPVKPGGD